MAAVSDSFTAFNFQNGAIHVSPRNWGWGEGAATKLVLCPLAGA